VYPFHVGRRCHVPVTEHGAEDKHAVSVFRANELRNTNIVRRARAARFRAIFEGRKRLVGRVSTRQWSAEGWGELVEGFSAGASAASSRFVPGRWARDGARVVS